MTTLELVYDIKHILKKLSDDSDISDNWLIHKCNEYRAIEIIKDYKEYGEINTSWIQNLGIYETTKVNSSDQQETVSSICFGKVIFPSIIKFKEDLGVWRLSDASNQHTIYPKTEEEIMLKIEANDFSIGKFKFFYKMGMHDYYFYPYITKVTGKMILENPFDAYIYTTTKVLSGNIKVDEEYTVLTGNIVYDGNTYNADNDFTGIVGITTFTGGGTVKHKNNSRKFNIEDQYPADIALCERIIIGILTNDFAYSRQQIEDIRNDAQDQTNLNANVQGNRR